MPKLLPASPIDPPTVRLEAETVSVGLAVRVMLPLPRSRLLLPANVKLPPQVIELLVESVIGPPLVLSIVPALMVNVPVPSADALLRFSVPAERVVPPA